MAEESYVNVSNAALIRIAIVTLRECLFVENQAANGKFHAEILQRLESLAVLVSDEIHVTL